MNKNQIAELSQKFGDAFYLLDTAQFRRNYQELKNAFAAIYPNVNIAYSYKTNYTPALCKQVNALGGYAEVVSDMEMEIALRIGVAPSMIIWNGPYKQPQKMEQLLVTGGIVNIDNLREWLTIKDINNRNRTHTINIGIRCNFEINDNVVSRFGFDTDGDDFRQVLSEINSIANIHLIGFQCHFATRRLETWKPRAQKMLDLLDRLQIQPEHIDLGGGLYGKIEESLKAQFDAYIPSYNEYANEVATLFAEKFGNTPNPPLLLIEPGSALVGDCMSFVAKVQNIKDIRGHHFATILGSTHNINVSGKNPPMKVHALSQSRQQYKDINIVGYTCIEADQIYRHYAGTLGVGDFVEFGNCGSYSVVLKPPFILPNFPVIDCSDGEPKLIKRQEYFDDLFQTFAF